MSTIFLYAQKKPEFYNDDLMNRNFFLEALNLKQGIKHNYQ